MKKYIAIGLSLILIVLIVTGCEAKKVEEVTDAEKISLEYNISKENKFIYADFDKIVNILNSDGIIYFGYPEKDDCKIVVEILTEVTKKENIAIYYFNPNQLTDKNNKNYLDLLKLLDQKEITVPSVYFIKDKKIIDQEIGLGKRQDYEYLTEKEVKNLTKIYQEKIKGFIKEQN